MQDSGKNHLVKEHQMRGRGADCPEEVLIALKFIRKLLKHLSGMLISFQKKVGCELSHIQKPFYFRPSLGQFPPPHLFTLPYEHFTLSQHVPV